MGYTVEDALRERKKKKKVVSVEEALATRKDKIKNELPKIATDLESRYTDIVNSYNGLRDVGVGKNVLPDEMTNRRLATDNITALKSDLKKYRNYIGADVADSYLSDLDKIMSLYDNRITAAQARSEFSDEAEYDTAVKQAGWHDKYSVMTADERQSALKRFDAQASGVLAGPSNFNEEQEWLKEYDEGQKLLEYDTEAAQAEADDIEAAATEYSKILDEIPRAERDVEVFADSSGDNVAKEVLEGLYAKKAELEEYLKQYGDDPLAVAREKRVSARDAAAIQTLAKYADVSSVSDFESKAKLGAGREDNSLGDTVDVGFNASTIFGYLNEDEMQSWHMTEDERKIYNYIFETEGKKAADKYFDALSVVSLDDRLAGTYENMTGDSKFLKTLFGVAAGIDQFSSGVKSIFSEKAALDTTSLQIAGQNIRDDLDGGWGVAYDLLNTTANQLPSIITSIGLGFINPTLGATAGTALMGISAAGNGYAEMKRLGYSDDQARAYGALVGVSEIALEKVLGGVSALGGIPSKNIANMVKGIDKAAGRIAVQLGASALSEAAEEGLQSILEQTMIRNIALGEDKGWSDIEWGEVAYSALLGGLSGGVLEGTTSVIPSEVSKARKQNAVYRTVGESVIAAESTNPLLAASEAYLANLEGKEAESLQKVFDKASKKSSAKNVGRLAVGFESSRANTGKADIESRLRSVRVSDVDSASLAIYKALSGEELTAAEDSLLNENSNIRDVYNGLATTDAGTKYLEYANALKSSPTEARESTGKAETSPASVSKDAEKMRSQGEYEVPESVPVTVKSTGETSNFARFVMADDGSTVVRLENGNTVAPEDVSYEGLDIAPIYEIVTNMDVSAAEANALVNGYRGDESPTDYALGIREAYAYGQMGLAEDLLSNTKYATALSDTARDNAFILGRMAGEGKDFSNEKGIHIRRGGKRTDGKNTEGSVRTVEKDTGSDQSRRKGRTGSRDRGTSALTYGEKVGTKGLGIEGGVVSDGVRIVTEGETAAMKKARRRAESRGLEVVFFAGDNLHFDDGTKARAYIEGNKVYIRVDHEQYNADQLMRHEVGHDMIARGEVDVDEVLERIIEIYGENAYDKIAEMYAEAYAREGVKLSADEIWEEIICDSLGDMNIFTARAGQDIAAVEYLLNIKEEAKVSKKPARAPPVDGVVEGKHSFAGEKANTADLESLENAKSRITLGEDHETVRRDTGWFKGYDGKWRFEIDDSSAVFRPEGDVALMKDESYIRLQELTEKWAADELTDAEYEEMEWLEDQFSDRVWEEKYRLDDYFDHPALYEAYPMLRFTSLVFDDLPDGERGYFDPRSNTIVLSRDLFGKHKNTLLHEVQHAIQKYEGFAKGSSPGYWSQLPSDQKPKPYESAVRERTKIADKIRQTASQEFIQAWYAYNRGEIEFLDVYENPEFTQTEKDMFWDYVDWHQKALDLRGKDKNDMELYESTAGEIEARDTASRADYTPERRKNTRPDIDRIDVVFADGKVSYFSNSSNKATAQSESKIVLNILEDNIEKIPKTNVFELESDGIVTDAKKSDYVNNVFVSQGGYVINKSLGRVELTSKGAKSTIFHGYGKNKLIAVDAIKATIEDGVIISVTNNYEKKGIDRYIIAAKGKINKADSYMAVVVEGYPMNGGHKQFYLHEVLTKETVSHIMTATQMNTDTVSETVSKIKIPQSSPAVKSPQGKTSREVEAKAFTEDEVYDILGESERIESENKILSTDVDRLRQLVKFHTQVDSGNMFTKSSLTAASKLIREYAGTTATTPELVAKLDKFYRDIADEKITSMDDIMGDASEIAAYIISRTDKTKEAKAYYKAILEGDADISKMDIRDTSNVLAEYDIAELTRDLATEIYDRYWDVVTLYSFADKKQTDVNLLKSKHKKAMKELREKRDAKIKSEQERYREMIRKVRDAKDAKYAKYREKNQESREKARMSKLRRDIKNRADRLVSMLLHPTDGRYVPDYLIKSIAKIANSISIGMDAPAIHEKGRYKGTENKALAKRIKTKAALQDLVEQYERMGESDDPAYSGEFDEIVRDELRNFSNTFGEEAILENMNLDQLRQLDELLRTISGTLIDARKLISDADKADVYEIGTSIIEEQEEINGRKNKVLILNKVKAKSVSPMRLVRAAVAYNEDSPFFRAFKALESGTRKKAIFMMEAYAMFEDLVTGSNEQKFFEATQEYAKTPSGKTFTWTDAKGRSFGVSKMQMMQAIMSYRREKSGDYRHIKDGGLDFADIKFLNKGDPKRALDRKNAHLVEGDVAIRMIEEFENILKNDTWAQQYMTVAEDFFNRVAKDAINEVSLEVRHRRIAKEKYYIPFEVSDKFRVVEINSEAIQQKTLEGLGMLKETKDGANSPLVMSGLGNVLDYHIHDVAGVYGLLAPVRNFNKIWNVKTGPSESVRDSIALTWGDEVVRTIEQAVRDVQYPAPKDRSVIIEAVKHGNIAATFLLNMSVVAKQLGSRHFATHHFTGFNKSFARSVGDVLYAMFNSKKILAETKKYTATLWERQQGLNSKEVEALRHVSYGFFRKLLKKGEFAISRGMSRLSGKNVNFRLPSISKIIQWMDFTTAASLWNTCKSEVRKNDPNLKGEALLKATAEYYDDLISSTQSVNDVLHTSDLQRNHAQGLDPLFMFKNDAFQMSGALQDAAGEFAAKKTKRTGKHLMSTLGGVLKSVVWTSAVSMFVAFWRRKEDKYRDEETGDLTTGSVLSQAGFDFGGEIIGALIPLGGSEVFSLIDNIVSGTTYDVIDNMAFDYINGLAMGIADICTKTGEGEKYDLSTAEGQERFANAAMDLVCDVLAAFGIPANNIKRARDAINLHIEDIADGGEWFSSGVFRTRSQNLNRVIRAESEGNTSEAQALFSDMVDAYTEDKLEDKIEENDRLPDRDRLSEDMLRDQAKKEVISDFKSMIGDFYTSGDMNKSDAKMYLSDYFDMTDNEIYWKMEEWDYKKQYGSTKTYSKYSIWHDAIWNGEGLREEIKRHLEHTDPKDGEKPKDTEKRVKSTLASDVTSHFKPLFIAAETAEERATIKARCLWAYVALGYDRAEKNEDIDAWLKDE